MIVDANILLYAADESAPQHARAREWLEGALNGPQRVGLPWSSLGAFVRIATNARASDHPLTPNQAWQLVAAWLDVPGVWVPSPGPGYSAILGDLIVRLDLRGNLAADAMVAALCIELGVPVVSADSDFARFPIQWVNPVA